VCPLLTSLIVCEFSRNAMFVAVVAIAGFLAHEPATILVGARGARARRDLGATAARQLGVCGVAGVLATICVAATTGPVVWWSLLAPAVPATCVAASVLLGREKSGFGEVAAAVAFSAAAVPMTLAGGGTLRQSVSIAIPFALLFVTSTLAVRLVVLRVRGGGDPRAARLTRHAVFLVAAFSAAALGAAIAADYVPVIVAMAAAPGVAAAIVVAARPPSPARLRPLGWILIAVSVVTTGILSATV
jgi:hypothetical protein